MQARGNQSLRRSTARKSTRAAKSAERPQRKPLPPRVAALLRESWLLLAIGAAIYLALILVTFQTSDPGWSHQATGSVVKNAGGAVGANIADILLSLFGLSTWWWVIASVAAIVWAYRRVHAVSETDHRPMALALSGFVILLLSSSAFEALRLYSVDVQLPFEAGGIVGTTIAGFASRAFGFTGSTLLLMMLWAVGVTLLTGLSWLVVIERLGGWIENAFLTTWRNWEAWRDRKAGAIAAGRRTVRVEEVKEKLVVHEPILIEKPQVRVPQSDRVSKEKQKPLFDDLPDSELPPLHLLDPPAPGDDAVSPETLEYTSRLIEKKLMDFGIQVRVVAAQPGPVITRFEIQPAVGIKGSQIMNLVKDIARSLSVVSLRVVETIPGKTSMGLEIPNPKRQVVKLSEILSSQTYAQIHSPLAVALGKDIAGNPVCVDLSRMPHLLVAGTTGSGKSVALNAMILSLLYKATPNQVRVILIDPKMLELSVYEGIPHLLTPVVTDMTQAAHALNWCVGEMDRRYKLMSTLGVRNLSGFNHKVRAAVKSGEPLTNPFTVTPDSPEPLQELPLIVVVIDELADLMMVVGKKIEEVIARLAQKARAAGIHLVLATQRPSVDVITGLIKANIPTRVAFQVSSRIDSRTILDQMGAEQLLGQGDMLYLPPGTGYPQRVHGAFVSDEEVHKVAEYLKSRSEPQYIDAVLESAQAESEDGGASDSNGEQDPLYDQAVEIVLKSRRASISLVQRHLRIGYNRAARLVEQMETAGLVSAMSSSGGREVLVPVRDEA
jgi:S-DNA-T family DNA segregation ATPase FtsK/SpoIIIE